MDGPAAAQKRMNVFWCLFSKKEQRFFLKKEAKTSDILMRCL
jgi:hypothetical protein